MVKGASFNTFSGEQAMLEHQFVMLHLRLSLISYTLITVKVGNLDAVRRQSAQLVTFIVVWHEEEQPRL